MEFWIIVLFLTVSLTTYVSGLNSEKSTVSQSKTYADFAYDVGKKLKLAKDPEYQNNVKHLSDQIYDLVLPVEEHLRKPRNFENITHTNYTSTTKSHGPDVLYKILKVLKQLLKDRQDFNSNCVADTAKLIIGLLRGTHWSRQFFDATGKPGPSLTQYRLQFVGNYDQCRSATAPASEGGFKGNYCVIGTSSQNPLVSLQVLALGACFPSTCSSREINDMTRDILKATNATLPPEALNFRTECRTAPTEVTTATIFAIIILSLVGIMVVWGTVFDILFVNNITASSGSLHVNDSQSPSGSQNGYKRFGDIEQNGEAATDIGITSSSSKSPNDQSSAVIIPQSVPAKILLAFSVYSNGRKLLSTSQAPGSLGAIHGIRFLSMSWVVLCHTFMTSFSAADNGVIWSQGFLKRWTSLAITNGFPSVDTFFTLSGLLTAYLTIKEMKKRNSWNINWPLFYFHRFWRLTPPYMFALVIALGLTQYLGEGPLWSNAQPRDRDVCEKNWWTNFLYINNVVNTKEMCFGHSWYLANDMQFFVISPLMLIPFFFHRLAGLLCCFILLLVHMVTTGVLSSVGDWPSTVLAVAGTSNAMGWFNDYYIKPWCRIGPFIVGILAGYILAHTKGKPFRMPWWGVVLGWVTAVASGLAVVYGLRGDISGEAPSSVGVAALYNAVSRSVWGACVSWVILACSAGYGGPVNAILSWSPFVFLGRLTYMSYLIHLPMIQILFSNLGGLIDMDDSIFTVMFLGILFFVNMVSVIAVLGLESPMLGLEKTFISKDRKG